MTREELREKVARALAATHGYEPDSLTYREADAAIAIIRGETLEEAARVAENSPHWTDNGPPLGKMPTGRNDIAAAIRALGEKA